MDDFSDATLRLSNDERDRAVAALQAGAAEGRLSDAELQTRSQAARAAVTRGDLVPLFADLPGKPGLDRHLPPGAASVGDVPSGSMPSDGTAAGGPANAPAGYARPGAPAGDRRWGWAIVSIAPFVALILFFLTGAVWGYAYSWVWFLLIPLAAALVYGTDGGRDRGGRRDR